MAVSIRLRRMGGRNQPFFRVVVTDSRRANQGRFLECVGWYDPKVREAVNFQLNLERIAYWQQRGAQVSETVRSLMRRARRSGSAGRASEVAPVAQATASEA